MADLTKLTADWLMRLLRVRPEERSGVLYFAGLFLLLGAGIAVGRGSADALFLKRYGIEYLPIVYGALSIVMAAAAMGYAAFADRLPAERLLAILLGILAVFLVAGVGIMQIPGFLLAYPGYFLIYEVSGELLLLHAAFYAWQNFESQQAKRLLPLLLAAGQVGTVCGGLGVAASIHVVGADGLVAAWAALVVAALALLRRHHRLHGVSRYYRARRTEGGVAAALAQLREGLRYTRDSVLIRAASLALLCMVVTFYVLSYSVSRIYSSVFATEESLGAFLGLLTAMTSAAAIVIQLFVTGRLLERFGLRRVNLVYPLANVGAFAALALAFALPAALLASIVKDVLMPAIRRPVRSLFFNALPDDVQGRARALSIAVVMPVGLAAASGILVVAQGAGSTTWVVVAGVVAATAYLAAAVRMNRVYVGTMVDSVGKRVFTRQTGVRAASFEELAEGVTHDDDNLALAHARRLVAQYPDQASAVVLGRLQRAGEPTRDRLLRLLAPLAAPELSKACEAMLGDSSPRLQSTALHLLFDRGEVRHAALVAAALDHSHPRMRAAGIHGALRVGPEDGRKRAIGMWHALLDSDRYDEQLAGLELLQRFPRLEMLSAVFHALDSARVDVQKMALCALARMPAGRYPALERRLRALLDSMDWEIRQLAVRCLEFLPDDVREMLALVSLEDSHPSVRREAIQLLEVDAEGSTPMLAGLLQAGAGSPRAQLAMLEALHRRGVAATLFSEVAALRAEDAAAIDAFLWGLGSDESDASPMRLLRVVLGERRRQFIDLALSAMCCTPDAQSVGVVQAALFSRDSRQRANGLEILRNLGDQRLARNLGDLIERLPEQFSMVADSARRQALLRRVLDWCAARPDPWLRRCARLVEHEIKELRSTHG